MTDPISNSTLGGDIGLGVGVVDLSGGIGERGLRKLIYGNINIIENMSSFGLLYVEGDGPKCNY